MWYWQWVAIIAVWFVIGPLFVLIFTTLGLDYFIGPRSTDRTRVARRTRPLWMADGTQRPRPPRSVLAFSARDELGGRPSAELEALWWMDRATSVEEPIRRAIGGN
jgi:hypothetical protein